MARFGVYGASFDPITNVHLWTASTLAARCKLDKVIFLPCSSKRRDKELRTADEHRLNMVKMAIVDDEEFVVDEYEMNQNAYDISTYATMKYFKKTYPDDEIFFIMGADLLVDIGMDRWDNVDKLIEENQIIVMARDGIDMLKTISGSPILRKHDDGTKFHLVDKGIAMESGSTYIRDEFAYGGNPKHLMPLACYAYIKQHGLYSKTK